MLNFDIEAFHLQAQLNDDSARSRAVPSFSATQSDHALAMAAIVDPTLQRVLDFLHDLDEGWVHHCRQERPPVVPGATMCGQIVEWIDFFSGAVVPIPAKLAVNDLVHLQLTCAAVRHDSSEGLQTHLGNYTPGEI